MKRIMVEIKSVLRYQEGNSDKIYIGTASAGFAFAFYGKTRSTLQKKMYGLGELQDKLLEKRNKGYQKIDDLSILTSAQQSQIKRAFANQHGVSEQDVHFERFNNDAKTRSEPKAPDPKIEQKRAETYDDW